jgi:hypothetical protein
MADGLMIRIAVCAAAGVALIGAPIANAEPGAYSNQDETFFRLLVKDG